jgi:hypothetical protein
LLIIFIKIYASNFVLHVVASLLGAGNAGKKMKLICSIFVMHFAIRIHIVVEGRAILSEVQTCELRVVGMHSM